MARKKTSAGKSRAGSKAVPARAGAKRTVAPTPSERVVPIPAEVSVFSELPFARLGTIGGGAESPSAASEEGAPIRQKAATQTVAAKSKAAEKILGKNAPTGKVAKGKKKAT